MRIQQTLSDGWYVKQIDTENPNMASLTQEAAYPDNTWLAIGIKHHGQQESVINVVGIDIVIFAFKKIGMKGLLIPQQV